MDAERSAANAEVRASAFERRCDEGERRRDEAARSALDSDKRAGELQAKLADAHGAKLEADLAAADAHRDAERAAGVAKNEKLEAEACRSESARLHKALDESKRCAEANVTGGPRPPCLFSFSHETKTF